MKLEITALHTDLQADLKKYVTKKVTKLEKYVPRQVRQSAHMSVVLKESHAKNKRQFTCEMTLSLTGDTISVSESTLNIFAATDIAEATMRNRIKKYKEKHISERAGKKEKKVRLFLGKILSR